MKTPQENPIRAMTIVEVIVVLAVLAILAAMFLPQLVRFRPPHSQPFCVNNLKQVGLSFRIWAGDNNDKYPAQVSVTNGGAMELCAQGNPFPIFLVMSNELSTPELLD
jgi:prepilin-type N-terminal cleavage/methylation domain-containing protein